MYMKYLCIYITKEYRNGSPKKMGPLDQYFLRLPSKPARLRVIFGRRKEVKVSAHTKLGYYVCQPNLSVYSNPTNFRFSSSHNKRESTNKKKRGTIDFCNWAWALNVMGFFKSREQHSTTKIENRLFTFGVYSSFRKLKPCFTFNPKT